MFLDASLRPADILGTTVDTTVADETAHWESVLAKCEQQLQSVSAERKACHEASAARAAENNTLKLQLQRQQTALSQELFNHDNITNRMEETKEQLAQL